MSDEEETEHESSFEKIAAWDRVKKQSELLKEIGAVKYFADNFPDLKDDFVDKKEAVVCMDEGCAHKDYKGEGKLSLAGSGILLPASSEIERVQIAARLFSELGIKNVTSHEGCGAVGLAFKRDFPDQNPTPDQLKSYGAEWTKKVVDPMKEMGRDANTDFISAQEMERPAEFHDAQVVYFDGVGGFNPNKESKLPKGFVVSRKFLPGEYAVEELKVAVGIAFGKHGLAKFNAETPFVVVVMADNAKSLADLQQEVSGGLEGNHNFSNIKIDGLVVEK